MDETSTKSGCALWNLLGLRRFANRKRSKPLDTAQPPEYQKPPRSPTRSAPDTAKTPEFQRPMSAQTRPSPETTVIRKLYLQEIPRVSSSHAMNSEAYDWNAYFEHENKIQQPQVAPLPPWSNRDADPAVFRRGPGAVARLVPRDQRLSEDDPQLSAQALHARGLQALQFHRRDNLPHKPAQYTTIPKMKR